MRTALSFGLTAIGAALIMAAGVLGLDAFAWEPNPPTLAIFAAKGIAVFVAGGLLTGGLMLVRSTARRFAR